MKKSEIKNPKKLKAKTINYESLKMVMFKDIDVIEVAKRL